MIDGTRPAPGVPGAIKVAAACLVLIPLWILAVGLATVGTDALGLLMPIAVIGLLGGMVLGFHPAAWPASVVLALTPPFVLLIATLTLLLRPAGRAAFRRRG